MITLGDTRPRRCLRIVGNAELALGLLIRDWPFEDGAMPPFDMPDRAVLESQANSCRRMAPSLPRVFRRTTNDEDCMLAIPRGPLAAE